MAVPSQSMAVPGMRSMIRQQGQPGMQIQPPTRSRTGSSDMAPAKSLLVAGPKDADSGRVDSKPARSFVPFVKPPAADVFEADTAMSRRTARRTPNVFVLPDGSCEVVGRMPAGRSEPELGRMFNDIKAQLAHICAGGPAQPDGGPASQVPQVPRDTTATGTPMTPLPPVGHPWLGGTDLRHEGANVPPVDNIHFNAIWAAPRCAPPPVDCMALIEAIRQATTAVVWGEQKNLQAPFEVFCEFEMLKAFVNALHSRALLPLPGLRAQLMQTLMILVQNARPDTSFLCLLSGDTLNGLFAQPPEAIENEEETFACFVALLKGVALRLDSKSAQLLLVSVKSAPSAGASRSATKDFHEQDYTCPLFELATMLIGCDDNIVRAAGRVAVLRILDFDNKNVRNAALASFRHRLAPRVARKLQCAVLHAAQAEHGTAATAMAQWPVGFPGEKAAQPELSNEDMIAMALEEEEDAKGFLCDLLALREPAVVAAIAQQLVTVVLYPLIGALLRQPPAGELSPDADNIRKIASKPAAAARVVAACAAPFGASREACASLAEGASCTTNASTTPIAAAAAVVATANALARFCRWQPCWSEAARGFAAPFPSSTPCVLPTSASPATSPTHGPNSASTVADRVRSCSGQLHKRCEAAPVVGAPQRSIPDLRRRQASKDRRPAEQGADTKPLSPSRVVDRRPSI